MAQLVRSRPWRPDVKKPLAGLLEQPLFQTLKLVDFTNFYGDGA